MHMGDFRFTTPHLSMLIVHSLLCSPTGNSRNREVKNLIQDEGKLGLKLFLVEHPASSLSSYHLLSIYSVQMLCSALPLVWQERAK